MKKTIGIVGSNIMNEYDNVIFEGAQGLLLDISLDYTFGTASHTGLENVRDLIDGSMLDSFTVIYATRPYLTRHGGGMLPNERDIISQGMKCVDGTNGFNVWQREFRLGLLDINTLKQNIKRDERFCASVLSKEWEIELFVSCADQIVDKQYYNYYDDGIHLTNHFDTVMENVARSLLANKLYISHGPERNSVTSKNFF